MLRNSGPEASWHSAKRSVGDLLYTTPEEPLLDPASNLRGFEKNHICCPEANEESITLLERLIMDISPDNKPSDTNPDYVPFLNINLEQLREKARKLLRRRSHLTKQIYETNTLMGTGVRRATNDFDGGHAWKDDRHFVNSVVRYMEWALDQNHRLVAHKKIGLHAECLDSLVESCMEVGLRDSRLDRVAARIDAQEVLLQMDPNLREAIVKNVMLEIPIVEIVREQKHNPMIKSDGPECKDLVRNISKELSRLRKTISSSRSARDQEIRKMPLA